MPLMREQTKAEIKAYMDGQMDNCRLRRMT